MIKKLLGKIFKINNENDSMKGYMKITRIDDGSISIKICDMKFNLVKKEGSLRFNIDTDELMKAIKEKQLLLATEDELAKMLLSEVDW